MKTNVRMLVAALAAAAALSAAPLIAEARPGWRWRRRRWWRQPGYNGGGGWRWRRHGGAATRRRLATAAIAAGYYGGYRGGMATAAGGYRGYWGPGYYWPGYYWGVGLGVAARRLRRAVLQLLRRLLRLSGGLPRARRRICGQRAAAGRPGRALRPAGAGRVAARADLLSAQRADAGPDRGRRQDCNRWATTQAGAMSDAQIFQRATYACMDGRGYTVR